MLIFIDTEFSDLYQENPKLISLALVPECGNRAFYAELIDGWIPADCSEFVKSEVLPHMKGGAHLASHKELCKQVVTWFAEISERCQIAADSEIDFRLLQQVFDGNWPANLKSEYINLRGMIISAVFDKARQEYFSLDRPPHNALNDAHANRCGWLAYTSAQKLLKLKPFS